MNSAPLPTTRRRFLQTAALAAAATGLRSFAQDAPVKTRQTQLEEDKRPSVLFLVGDEEYKSGETVPEWAKTELAWRGVRCTFVIDDPKQPATLAGLEKLPAADALFISLKRRALTPEQFALIRHHSTPASPCSASAQPATPLARRSRSRAARHGTRSIAMSSAEATRTITAKVRRR